jgi:hypothetical protein
MITRTLVAALAASVLVLAACGKKEPPPPPPPPAPAPAPVAPPPPPPAPVGVTVGEILLGKAVGPDKKVVQVMEVFAVKDPIHASVATTGAGKASVKAKWTFTRDGKTVPVKEDVMMIETTGPAINEFHISKPDGWPVGDYMVEIFVDDKPAGSRKFSVK